MAKARSSSVFKTIFASFFFLWVSSLWVFKPVTAFPADEKGSGMPFSRFLERSERETLKKMSIEEKIGQLLVFGFQGKSLDDDFAGWLSSGKLGNVKIFLRNVESREQVTGLTGEIERLCAKTRSRVPPFIATDMEGGTVNHVRYAGIALAPAAGLVGATGEAGNAGISSRLVALTLAGIGINMNFAPCADVLTEPRNRVIMTRSYGSDPEMVAEMAAAFVREQARFGIFSVMKHFPGHGMTAFDSHLVSEKVDTSKQELERRHLLPYRELIGGKTLDGVMTAHIIYNALDPRQPATFSAAIIGGLLRNELGFDGIVVTDELEMEGAQKVSRGIVDSFVRAFEAGNDLFLVGHTKSREAELIEELPKLFSGGRLSVEELDRRVLLILSRKKRFLPRFFENRRRAASLSEISLVAAENRKIAENGIVLLSSRVKGSIPAFLKETAAGKKGVILAPTEGFARLAQSYLPSWDVVDMGYRPDREENTKAIADSRQKLRSHDLALLGLANETHEGWADACIDEKLPFFVLSIDNPFAAGTYDDRALFIAACFGPYSPATDALFRSVFVTGEFKGRFPYDK